MADEQRYLSWILFTVMPPSMTRPAFGTPGTAYLGYAIDPATIKDIGVIATILAGKVTLASETRHPL